MNVVSLFTGVGGFDLGLERAGHRIVAQCEADEKARAVLRRHWPDVPVHEDVCGFDERWLRSYGLQPGSPPANQDLQRPGTRANVTGRKRSRSRSSDDPVDLVCGGFPCQDLSVAGKRAGLAGERSGLFFEAARISDLVLGDGGWVLIENVPGLLSSNGGRDFGIVLATLADLGFHDLAWRVLDSRYLGVPQRRRRVFVLARRARGRRAAEVLLEPESGGGNHQAGEEARQGTTPDPSPGAGGDNGGGVQSVAGALTKRYGKGINSNVNDGAIVLRGESWPLHQSPPLDASFGRLQGQDNQHERAGFGFFVPADGSLRESAGGVTGDPVHPATNDGRGEARTGLPDDPAGSVGPTPDSDGMRTSPGVPGRVDDPEVYGWADELMDRPRRNEIGTIRIGSTVGAPTASIVYGDRAARGPASPVDPRPDGPRYAQMGNAVTVNVAYWIGHRLREFGE